MTPELERQYRAFWHTEDPAERRYKICSSGTWHEGLESARRNWHDLILTRHVLDRLPQNPHVLEWGCGIGRMLQTCPVPGAHLIGVDMTQSMLDEARQYVPHGTELLLTPDGINCPCDGFDLGFSIITLQHVPTDKMVRGILRGLRANVWPGGTVRLQTHRGPPIQEDRVDQWHGRYWPALADFAEAVQDAGFTILEAQEGLGHPDWFWVTGAA